MFLCRLRSIAAHRDNFVRRLPCPSVCVCVCLVVTHSYVLHATHAILGMLPLCFHPILRFQGDEADCMYFIEDGEVRVTVKNMVSIHEIVIVVMYVIFSEPTIHMVN